MTIGCIRPRDSLIAAIALGACMTACSGPDRAATSPQAHAAQAAPPVAARNAQELLHEAIGHIATHALGRDRIDWRSVEAELTPTLPQSGTPDTAYPAILAALAKLNDPHASFIPGKQPPAAKPSAAPATHTEPPTPPQPAHPQIPTTPQGSLLPDGVAYLVVPGCTAPDVDGLRAYARAASDEIARLTAMNPAGWVVDLRLNGGGNIWPMLLGLHALLDTGPLMATVAQERTVSTYGLSDRGPWIDWGSGPEIQLEWGDVPPPPTPRRHTHLAIAIGSWTMSSGEALALCLDQSEHTRLFGEPTAGLTTINNFYPLSDGSVLNLPVAHMARLSGSPAPGKIQPEEPVGFDGWPSADDPAALAARHWALGPPR